MDQKTKARDFAALHIKGRPVILYNIWDAGTARAVAEGGAKALATGSWSVAAAQGYADGEKLPLAALIATVTAIVAAIELPLSVDFEGAYAEDPEEAAANVARVIDAGGIGINFEDQIVGGSGLYPAARQAERIAAIRAMADARGLPLFINARTDLFLKESEPANHGALLPDAIERGKAYAAAGASGFFVPGLIDPISIETLCRETSLPVNIMMKPGAPDLKTLATLGVGRISYGPGPYRAMIATLTHEAEAIYATAR